MSLTDKVIKNTLYHLLSQVMAFLSPLILTPIIISKIGKTDFGIYVLVLGFLGSFGLLDISLSSSFVKFISEYYNKKEKESLLAVINTGFLFYFIFSLLVAGTALIFSNKIISIINIPPDKILLAQSALSFGLIIFFLSSTFTIFNSVIVGLQKMYLGALASFIVSCLYFAAILVLMLLNFGLLSILITQLSSSVLSIIITIIIAKKILPELKIHPRYFTLEKLKLMGGFGIQMQISRLATFASEKYDEFLLGIFTALPNVTFYNIGNKSASYGKLIPLQFIAPLAPVAAELNAKNEIKKLSQLYIDSTKYLNTVSVPIFIFLIFFSELVLFSWMGEGYEISALILRILAAGYLINFMMSVPGNSIIPNTGKPKYQMYEGLIFLSINILLSYFLVKNYGIFGAAIGCTVSTLGSSVYIFFTSNSFFKTNALKVIRDTILKPLLISIASALICYGFYFIAYNIRAGGNRISSIIFLIIIIIIYSALFILFLLNSSYFSKRDLFFFVKFLTNIPPINFITAGEKRKINNLDISKNLYKGEFVSICIITHNRLKMLEKSLSSLLPTLKNVNYELIIWDNNSNDGTGKFLESLQKDSKNKIVFNEENIGKTARGNLFELANGEFIIGLDDDVWDFPDHWVQDFIAAYRTVPNAGFISTDVVQDSTTTGAKFSDEHYIIESFSDGKVIFESGPAGGWCFMLSRDVYNKVGKFYYPGNRIFFGDDGDYSLRTLNKGYRIGILKGLKVYHATGPEHNLEYKDVFQNKMQDLIYKTPYLHLLKNNLLKIFTIKRYINRFLEQIDRLILSV